MSQVFSFLGTDLEHYFESGIWKFFQLLTLLHEGPKNIETILTYTCCGHGRVKPIAQSESLLILVPICQILMVYVSICVRLVSDFRNHNSPYIFYFFPKKSEPKSTNPSQKKRFLTGRYCYSLALWNYSPSRGLKLCLQPGIHFYQGVVQWKFFNSIRYRVAKAM